MSEIDSFPSFFLFYGLTRGRGGCKVEGMEEEEVERKGQEGVPDGYKRCSKCGEVKSVGEFSKKSSGFLGVDSKFKVCKREYQGRYKKTESQKQKYRERASANYRLKHPLKPVDNIPAGYKKCSKCKEIKAVSCFSKGKNKDGMKSQCKDCIRIWAHEYNHELYLKNRELFKNRSSEYAKNNREKINARKAKYREKQRILLAGQRAEDLKIKKEERAKIAEKLAKEREEKKALDKMDREMYAIIARDKELARNRERSRRRYLEKAEEIKAYHAKYRKENGEKIREYNKIYQPIYYERTELINSAKGKLKRAGINPDENKELLESVMLQTRLKRVVKSIKSHKEVTNG